MGYSENSSRIAKNTFLLYIRMLFNMGVSLYTFRLVLKVLGVEDYGIYNVVGGIVLIFSFLNGTMATATQRFVSIELGRNDLKRLTHVFSTSLLIHGVLACLILLLAESVGLWFLNYELVIPTNRIVAANWVYQCSILSFLVSILSVPYNAMIIAYEKMNVFAYITILEVIFKLLIVVLLMVCSVDKLILYSVLLLFISILIRIISSVYCKRTFVACNFKFKIHREIAIQMSSFAGWNTFGCIALVAREQGINMLLNIFCGPVVNAARGVAYQVNTAVNSFISNFQLAMDPQIVKSYAENNEIYLSKLIYNGTRYSYYLLLFLSLPILIETEPVFKLWLGEIPQYTIIFVRIILITSLVESLSHSVSTAHLATGKIKLLQLIVGFINFLSLPISYILLRNGFLPYWTMLTILLLSMLCFLLRLILYKRVQDFLLKSFLKIVVLNILWVSLIASIFPLLLKYYFNNIHFIIILITCILSSFFSIVCIGLHQKERSILYSKIKQYYNHFFSH